MRVLLVLNEYVIVKISPEEKFVAGGIFVHLVTISTVEEKSCEAMTC